MVHAADKRNKLVDESEISLVIDTYDDIFSDFDPRPFDHRVLSFDFLLEVKRAAREKVTGLELKFMMPVAQRSPEKEEIIIKRLHHHFEKHAHMQKKERTKILIKGILISILGFFLTSSAAVVSYFNKDSILATVCLVVLEPAGWFSIWNGFEMMFQRVDANKDEYTFYHKMASAEIVFNGY